MSPSRALSLIPLLLAAACGGGGETNGGVSTGTGAGGQASSSSTSSSSSSSSTGGLVGGGGTGGGTGGSGGVMLADCATPPAAGELQLMAQGSNGAFVAATQDFLYWPYQGKAGEDGTASFLYQIPISCTGEVHTWGLGLSLIQGLLVNQDEVFIAGFELLTLPIGGATDPVTLTPALSDFAGLALDQSHVYWPSRTDGAIYRAPLAGGPRETFISGEQNPSSVAVSATDVYWSTDAGEVRSAPKSAQPIATILATGQNEVRSLTADAIGIYWIDRGPGAGNGAIRHLPFGGAVTTLASGLSWPEQLAADGSHVYFTDGGNLARVSLAAPGAVEIVASGLQAAAGLALAKPYAYVTDRSAQALYRVAY